MKTRILYLTYDGLSDPLGQSQIIPYLLGLSQKGYCITIISCEKKQAFKKSRRRIEDELNNYNISWYPLLYTKYPQIVSTLYDLYKFRVKSDYLFKRKKYDIVHCRSYITSLIGLYLKNKYDCKFIFDMRGFWADERVDGKLWDLGNPIYKYVYHFFKKKEKELLRTANYIISLTHQAKTEINSWKLNGEIELPIAVIPCCVDTELFSLEHLDQNNKIELKRKLHLTSNFILSYLGAIGTWYLLEEMLDFFRILLLEKPDSHFLFITPESKNIIRRNAKEKGIPLHQLTIFSASREEVPALLSLSNASIFFIKPVYSKIASSPTKQGEIMSMGIPIVCNANIGDTDEIIEASNAGVIIKNFGEENYKEAIRKLTFENFNPSEIRRNAQYYFSLEKGIESYHHVYNNLC
jgi:glycosyltransferase involved in cell wall biosynthesis